MRRLLLIAVMSAAVALTLALSMTASAAGCPVCAKNLIKNPALTPGWA